MRLELTLPALERLIGGDTEIEIGIRQQIVEAFCKKHIKVLFRDEIFRKLSIEWKADLDKTIREEITLLRKAKEPKIEDETIWDFKSFVRQSAQAAVDEAVAKIIAYQRAYFGQHISEAVRKALDIEIEKLVSEGIMARLEAAKNIKGHGDEATK